MRWNHKHTNANTQIQKYTNTQIQSVSVPHVLNLSFQLQFAKLHSNRMFTSASYYEKQCLYLRIFVIFYYCIIVFVFVFKCIVMHNGLSCQCVSVVPAGGAIFGEAVRRHKPAPCNQLYFYFLYFVLWFIYLVNACVRCTLYLFDYLLCFFYLQAVCICIHSKSEKVSGTAFSVEKNCRKSA